jgi:oxalate decarboxylase/phosphoglucose isomerase-like protein (cupin superfamily)
VKTEPYLGAGGHLVALREGDMAFLHVHPMDDGAHFAATFPTAGRYRLFLQFKHEGQVQTVAFTQEVS